MSVSPEAVVDWVSPVRTSEDPRPKVAIHQLGLGIHYTAEVAVIAEVAAQVGAGEVGRPAPFVVLGDGLEYGIGS